MHLLMLPSPHHGIPAAHSLFFWPSDSLHVSYGGTLNIYNQQLYITAGAVCYLASSFPRNSQFSFYLNFPPLCTNICGVPCLEKFSPKCANPSSNHSFSFLPLANFWEEYIMWLVFPHLPQTLINTLYCNPAYALITTWKTCLQCHQMISFLGQLSYQVWSSLLFEMLIFLAWKTHILGLVVLPWRFFCLFGWFCCLLSTHLPP